MKLDREGRARHRSLEDAEGAVEELLQVEDGVELGRELGEDGELAARRRDLLFGGLDDAACLDHRDECVHHGGVVPLTGEALDLGERLVLTPSGPVRPIGEHRLEGDRNREDPRRERDLLAGERVWVTGAVPALVGVPDDRDDPPQEADGLEDAGAEERVLLHDLALLDRQRTGLREDRRGHADLAERVEERGIPQVAQLGVGEVQALADGDRVLRDLALVILAVVVPGDDRRHERRDRRQVRVVQLAVQADRADRRSADAGEDADELAIFVGEGMRLAPGDEEHADVLVRRAQWMHEKRLVAEALEELARALGRLGSARKRERLRGLEDLGDGRGGLWQRQHVARGLPRGEREFEVVAALVEIDRADLGLHEVHDRLGEDLRHLGELGLLGDREADAVELKKASRERGRAVVQVGAFQGDRRLVRDRLEELQVALVVRGQAAALRADRADDRVALAQRGHDDGVLLDRAPGGELGKPLASAVALDLAQEDRPAVVDRRAGERSLLRAVHGLELLAAVDEEAVAHRLCVGTDGRDEEVVSVHDRRDLLVDDAEDLRRIERASYRVTDLDERGEEACATLGVEACANVEIPEDEQRDARDEEPGLDEDDLDRDDRGEPPEQLRAGRPDDPTEGLTREPFGAEHELQREDLPEVEDHERERGERAREDDLADRAGDPVRHRVERELEDHRRGACADRLRRDIAHDPHERLAARDVDDQPRGGGDERELARRKKHDPGEHRDLGGRELDVRRDAHRTEREEDAERPDVEGHRRRRRIGTERVLEAERDERDRRQTGDRHEAVRAPGNRSHPCPSCQRTVRPSR